MWILVSKQLIIMLIIALIGFCVSKAFKFEKKEQQCVSKLLMYFINPCLIISRFNIPYDSQKIKSLGLSIIIAIVLHLLMICLSLLLIRSKNPQEQDLDKLDRIATVFTNCGFIGIPLINGVLGEQGVFYLLGYLVVFNVFLWTFGYVMVGQKMQLKKIITNPNIIAVVIGLFLFVLPFQLPDIIAKPLSHIGAMNTATAMLLLGMLFATFKLNNNETAPDPDRDASDKVSSEPSLKRIIFRIAKLNIIRLIIMIPISLAVVFASFKIFNNFQDIRTICYVLYICSLTPVAMSVSSFAVLFNKDQSYSGLLVMSTSTLCIITLPLAIAIAEKVF